MATKKYVSEKQRTIRVLVIALIAVVALSLIFIGAAVLYSNHLNSGSAQRNMIALESEHYEVNNCMMTYYFCSDFYNTYNTYGQYFISMGLDPHSSMRNQAYDETSSWFDYFLNNTGNNVYSYLYYAEAAYEAGFEVENLDELVDDNINNLKESAEKMGLELDEYITDIFGLGIKESDIRDALELSYISSEYYNKIEGEYFDSLTDEDFEKHYSENKNALDKIDYRSYTVSASVAEDADEATKNTAYAEAKAEAEALLAASTTAEGFVSWVKAHLAEKNGELETPLSEDEIQAQADAVTEKAAYSESDFFKWAYEEGRAAGETKLIDDGAGNYTVYMLEKTPYRVEDVTKDAYHILLTPDTYGSDEDAAAKADEILATYETGEKTAEAFEALAEKFNEDSSSLYENVARGTMVSEYENWIYDEARAEGDTGIIKTSYGYHVMYFAGDGLPQWKVDAYNTMLEGYITQLVEGYQEKYVVETDSNALYNLPDTIPTTAFSSNEETVNTEAVAEETAEIE